MSHSNNNNAVVGEQVDPETIELVASRGVAHYLNKLETVWQQVQQFELSLNERTSLESEVQYYREFIKTEFREWAVNCCLAAEHVEDYSVSEKVIFAFYQTVASYRPFSRILGFLSISNRLQDLLPH